MQHGEWMSYVKANNRCPLAEYDGDMRWERYCLGCKHHYFQTVGGSNCCPRCAAQQPEPVIETAYVAERDAPLPDNYAEFEYKQVIHAYDHPQPVEERPAFEQSDQEIKKERAA